MARKNFQVEGMSCGHCVAKVNEILDKIKGVNEVNVDLNNSSVTLELDEGVINEILLKRSFNKNGSYTLN